MEKVVGIQGSKVFYKCIKLSLIIDFQVIPSTVTLSPDTTSATLSILVTNDAVTEPDETFQFTINATSDQSAILVNNTVTLTIDSDDG